MSVETKAKTKTVDNFSTAISTYYKLKGDYENKTKKSIKEIYNNSSLNSEQKREKYIQLKKKCIVCGKAGGTIFEQDDNMLIAKCGHIESPCKLDIKLERAKYDNIIDYLSQTNTTINSYKNNIIDTKLDYLFGFTNHSSTISKFDELKSNLVKIVKLYQDTTNKYINTIYNYNEISKINSLNSQLDGNINTFKENIQMFNESGEISYVKDAVELYVNTIKVVNKQLREAKYKLQEIYKNKDTDVVYLIQKIYTLSDLLIIQPGTENKVISFSV
tara:strand:- start:1929 stop:2750 length:822 start_codon:yes stop_codon:yes gene_type:complete